MELLADLVGSRSRVYSGHPTPSIPAIATPVFRDLFAKNTLPLHPIIPSILSTDYGDFVNHGQLVLATDRPVQKSTFYP
jgi:hypothetical protein